MLDRIVLLVVALTAVVFWIAQRSVTPRVAPATRLATVAGIPIFGNLLQLGWSHRQVRTLAGWAKAYGPIFQARLGNRRLVFVNSFDAVRDIFVKQHQALSSRPIWHTFHTVASGGKDFTIGSSPWSEHVKRLRQVVAQDATRTAVQGHAGIIATETADVVGRIFEALPQQRQQQHLIPYSSTSTGIELDPGPYLRHYCINTVLQEYLGLRLHHINDADVMDDLITAERSIAKIRSMANNFQDYIPWLRLWPTRNAHARDMNRLQDKFTDELIARFQRSMAAGVSPKCVAREFVNRYEGPGDKLSDVKILLLSVIAASVLTIPGNLIMPIGWLACAADGASVQEEIYADLIGVYGGDVRQAWEGVIVEERSERLVAFMKESLRYWTVLPMALGRESTKEVHLPGGGVVPAETEFHMNAWAANRDPVRFERPHVFDPSRYLGLEKADSLDHLSFGAGSRMCPGMHLGTRMIYAMLGRILLAYRVMPPRDGGLNSVGLDPLDCRVNLNGIALDPKPFRVTFVQRESFEIMDEVVEGAKVARGDVARR